MVRDDGLPRQASAERDPGDETRYLLTSPSGITAVVSSHGATLVALTAPDRDGRFADIVLGFDTRSEYVANADMYLGATIGRVASRIGGAVFVLDGVKRRLAANDGRNHLHGGGPRSFDKVNWRSQARTSPAGQEVILDYRSPDGEEGYPGSVDVQVVYRLTPEGELQIEFEATTDRPTPVSLTNHAYFNLAGAGAPTILDHELSVAADRYTPTDGELIPTGDILPVEGTPLDLREPAVIGDRIDALGSIGGFDHNFVLDPNRQAGLPAARVRHPGSGRVLEIWTGQPCLQVYSGNLMRPVIGKLGLHYARRSGFCLEPQRYPGALAIAAFPSIVIGPGTTYRETTRYRLGVDARR